MRSFILASSAALVLGGCMIGPDYTRPQVSVPAEYRFEPKEVADTLNSDWWKRFGDPVLDGLIAEALANNKSVQIATANVQAAAGVLTQTEAPLFPQVSYGAQGARARYSEDGSISLPSALANPRTNYQILAGATWEIDLWGRIRRLTESAQAQLLASEEARRGVILSLVASVAGSYAQLLGLDEQLAISKKTLAAYKESLRLFELQFKYGQVSEMTVAQARSQYETAAAQIPAIERQIGELENALSVLLGRNPGPVPRGKTILTLKMPPIPAGLPSELLERRPDILQAEQTLIAANAQIGAAQALYFPAISLTGAFGSVSGDLSNLFKGPSRAWSYTGSITGPIFTAGAISGQVEQAKANQQAALEGYQLAIQNAFADVGNALVSREKLGEQIEAQQKLVGALRDYSRLARLQYDGGYAPYMTVLQAEQQLFPAELSLAATRAANFNALVNIYKAMGGGWVIEADNLTATKPDEPKAKPAGQG